MKKFLLLPLLLLVVCCTLSVQAQELQKKSEEVTTSWKNELEKLTKEHQTPIGAKSSSQQAGSISAPDSKDVSQIDLNQLLEERRDELTNSKSAELSQAAWDRQMQAFEALKKEKSMAMRNSQLSPTFQLNDAVQQSPEAAIDKKEMINDEYLTELKKAIHQKNVEQQRRIIENGISSVKSRTLKNTDQSSASLDKLKRKFQPSENNETLKVLQAKNFERASEHKVKNTSMLDSKTAAEIFRSKQNSFQPSNSTINRRSSSTMRTTAAAETVFSQTALVGNWKIEPVAGALAVGPGQGDGSFWTSDVTDITLRDCYYDDVWTFDEFGSIAIDMGNFTWIEPWQNGGAGEFCDVPVAPHDGSGTYSYEVVGSEITVFGTGMYLGLPKAFNGGELSDPANAPSSISYIVSDYSFVDGVKRMTLDIDISAAQDGSLWWRFKMIGAEAIFSTDVLVGDWKMNPVAGAFGVGPAQGDMSFFANTLEDVDIRSCYFDDTWTFDEFGSVSLDLQGETWLEGWQGFDGCGTPVAPHDGLGTYAYFTSGNQISVEGQGMYLGLPKAFNGGELTSPDAAPSLITYLVTDYRVEGGVKYLTLDIDISAAQDGSLWWRFEMIGEAAPSAVDIDQNDYDALITLRDSLGGDLTNMWLSSMAPSEWPNVSYDGTGKVTGLFLDQTSLSGKIPNALSTMDSLRFLSMGGNFITGLPAGMGNLTKIEQIWLWGNDIQSLPADFFELSQTTLYSLDLSDSRALGGGTLDAQFGSLTKLTRLYLRGLELTGLTAEFGNLKSLRELQLQANRMTSLPDEFGGLDSLMDLDISQNALTTVPATFSGLDHLRELSMWGNPSNTTDVSVFFGMDSLRTLDAYNNNLGGTLSGISGSPRLEYVYLGENAITGGIPSEISVLTQLREFRVHNNLLDGTLDAALFELPNLYQIELFNNSLTGAFPQTSGSDALSSIALGGNNLETLTDAIGNFPNLVYLDLKNNAFTGPLPVSLVNDTSLIDLRLMYNQFTGGIPTEWGAFSNLGYLYLTGNQLSEPIPAELGNITTLRNLAIDQNMIPGAIPASFSGLDSLRELYIYDNLLTDLPDLSGLTSMYAFYAFGNYFEFDDFESIMQIPVWQSEQFGIDPQISPAPQYNYVSVGQEVVIDATVGGTKNHYEWYYNGNLIEGYDAPVISIQSMDLDSAGTYWCQIYSDSVTFNTNLYLNSGDRTYWISAPVSESDSLALVEIYKATHGENWNRPNNWLEAPVVMWEGVFLKEGRVYKLDLYEQNLQGGLPPAIGNLDALTWLNLWNNPGMEYLPGELFSLSNLHYLDLDNVGLRRLSPGINQLQALDTLWIGVNPFDGAIPKSIFSLTNLKLLGMQNTTFSGELPEEISQLINLEGLWLNGNSELFGDLPAGFSNLSNLKYLNLSNTPFTGGLENVGALTNLEQLYLYGSALSYIELPDEFANLTNIERLGLGFADYSIKGIPPEIFEMKRMKVLQMPASNVNNFIPDGFANLDSLTFLNLRDNGLIGAFPSGMEVDSLYSLFIQGNSIDDISLFESATKLDRFSAFGNKLDFNDLAPFYEYFNTHENYSQYNFSYMQPVNEYDYRELALGDALSFSLFTFPAMDTATYVDWYFNDGVTEPVYLGGGSILSLGAASNPESDGIYDSYMFHEYLSPLTDLQISGGTVQVEVLESVKESDSLALVAIYEHFGDQAQEYFPNWVDGDNAVETWVGVTAYGGRVLGLELHGLEGTIPGAAIAAFDTLQFLSLTDGNLVGTIPSEIYVPTLKLLDLGRNMLSGPIPEVPTGNYDLEVLGLAGNYLSGSIPASLSRFVNLTGLYLDYNRLTGALPSSFEQLSLTGFSVDRNRLSDIPVGFVNAFDTTTTYVNFEINNFDFVDLLNGSGNNLQADYSYYPQGSARMITWTGNASIDSVVTLHAERQSDFDEFYWFRADKYAGPPSYQQIGYTGNDSTFTFTIGGEWDQANYMAVIVNPEYKFGSYPFLTYQIPVDPYAKRFAVAQESPAFENPFAVGDVVTAPLGYPDVPPVFYGDISRENTEWWWYTGWWHSANQPAFDTLSLTYENPIAINYIRLHSPANDLNISNMILRGTAGEAITLSVDRIIGNNDNQLVFPKTSFAVSTVDLVVSSGSVDAFEVGDTGTDIVQAPELSDVYTNIDPNYLYIEVIYAGLADYIVIDRSTDGETFQTIDSIAYTGWYYDEVPSGKYYYRARVVFEELGITSGYSEVLATGNCEPTIPTNKIWSARSISLETGSFSGMEGFRDTVYVSPTGNYGQYNVSDITAGWYDPFFGFYESGGEFYQKCDSIVGYSFGQISEYAAEFKNDTLYFDWWDYRNNVNGYTIMWQIGDQKEEPIELERPYGTTAKLISKSNIELTWEDDYNPEGTSYIIQRSIGVSSQYENIATIENAHVYRDVNALDGVYRYYRVIARYLDDQTYPSSETSIVHKAPIFDQLDNAVTTDITRTSYGGAWGDFDADGDDDLYVSNAFDFAKNFLYENTGGGTFRKVVGTSATSESLFNRAAVWGDYNNDGFLDLFSPGRSNATGTAVLTDRIFQNTGSRSFVVTNQVELDKTETNAPSESGTWVDLDNDGWLDLVKSTGFILMNDGTGKLILADTLVADEGPLSDYNVYFWTVSNVDVDNDGDQDIYLTSDYHNMLFVNNGAGELTYVENGISNRNLRSRGYTWADFNNDGLVDLMTGETDMINFGIYKNNGDGSWSFIDVAGVNNGEVIDFRIGRGYTVADFDNNGLVDIILNLDGQPIIVLNSGFFKFTEMPIEDQAFPETNVFSHVSVADVNKDGAMDIFLPNQDFGGQNYMYLNNNVQNSWISVQLKGIKSNKSGIGARITVEANNVIQTQQVRTQNGISSGNSLAAEFGLGSAATIDNITVYWPSGDTTRASDVAVNQFFAMVEVVPQEGGGPTVNETDSSALVLLYNETGGENWNRNQGWKEGSPLAWEGTFWSKPAPDSEELPRLISLILNDNNLTDTIPDGITALSALEVLDLSQNSLSGAIPLNLGSMTSLVNLSLGNNDLTGKIPESIGSLVNLENLDLYNNNMFGELPVSLGGLQNLKQFEIQNNDFIGFVPEVIGTLSNLEILKMDHNEFEGALPTGLGAMESLAVMYLNDNFFTGELPSDLGDLSNLVDLRLENNNFFGTIPETFAQLTGIEYVDISNNDFEGSLSAFALLDTMYYLNAASNMFTDLGDITKNTSDTIIVVNNWLDFGDFETNNTLVTQKRLGYNPQDSLYEEVDSLHTVGERILISYAIGGQFNSYTWKLNGEPYVGDNTNAFVEGNSIEIFNPETPHEGEYVLEVTNENYPDMVLVTRPFNLKLTSLERDKKALLAFIKAVDAAGKYSPANWSEANDITAGNWEGVTLNATNDRVIGLALPAVLDTDLSNGDQSRILEGRVPLSFVDLSGIQTLDLSNNRLTSLPNISGWLSLSSANVSRNKLNFSALIDNVKLGAKLTYSPQRRIDETLYDTLTAGDNPILSVADQGFGATYQWKFGPYIPGRFFNDEVKNITGATSRRYQIENLDYYKMGTYRVQATHPKVPNLVLESRNKNIMAATSVFGTVSADDQGTLLTAGEVITFRMTPTGPFVPEDTVQLNASGEYQIDNVVLGDFIVLTKPDRAVYPNDGDESGTVIDTYFGQADLFENADTLKVREKSSGVDIEMIFYAPPAPAPNGADFEGELFSDVEQDTLIDEESRILARKKVKRAACSMRRYVGSGRTEQNDADYELYAYVESDDEGKFNFTGVEEGTYRLNIQYPGVPMDPNSDIEFIVGGDKENQKFTLSAVITEEGIQVVAEEVLYTLKPYIKDVNLYPNPTLGKMKADFLVYRRLNDLKLEVLDTRGVKLFEQELDARMGVQSTEIDLTNYKAGVYFVTFTDGAGTFRHQLKVTKQ